MEPVQQKEYQAIISEFTFHYQNIDQALPYRLVNTFSNAHSETSERATAGLFAPSLLIPTLQTFLQVRERNRGNRKGSVNDEPFRERQDNFSYKVSFIY